MKRKLWLVAYDVSDAMRLHSILKIITYYSSNGQKSCYEAWLTDKEAKELENKISNCLNDDDKWAMFPIGIKPITRALGIATLPSNPSSIFIGWE